MKKATLFLLAFCCAMGADEAARHKERMDAAQDLTYDLKDALDAKSSEKAAAAKDGQFDRALQAYAELQTSCRTCHDLHFEKRLAQTHP